jgi:nucleoside-diphosphate-sugar epimerase
MAQVGSRLASKAYQEDLALVAQGSPDWSVFDNSTIAVSGATGMIGTFLIDVLMQKNLEHDIDCHILALGRDEEKARARLPYFGNEHFSFEELDVSIPGSHPAQNADIVIHLASPTHPKQYSSNPIGTITSNVMGLTNLMDFITGDGTVIEGKRFCFASSVEIYGQNRGDVEMFDESYLGYIDCNTLRAGYPESKRLGEALCQAYATQRGLSVHIPRLPRTYGPTMLPSDSKAIAQFIKKAVAGEDIVLKSEGNQLFSYLYVADTVSGMLHVLTHGESGMAYNLADADSNVSLRSLAQSLADAAGTSVIFELPDESERRGYSTATKALLDPTRIQQTGWKAHYDITSGLNRTVAILKELQTATS